MLIVGMHVLVAWDDHPSVQVATGMIKVSTGMIIPIIPVHTPKKLVPHRVVGSRMTVTVVK